MGFCSGIENYSGPLTFRERGATPYTLLDYFPDDMLFMVDESHVTLPQIRAMYNGDQREKRSAGRTWIPPAVSYGQSPAAL